MKRLFVSVAAAASLVGAPAAQAGSGDIYVSEPFSKGFTEGAVIKVVPPGPAQTYLAEAVNLPVTETNQLAFEPPRAVVVATGASKTIVRVDVASGAQSVVASADKLTAPFGVAVAPSGQIVATDPVNGLIGIDPVTGAQTVLSSSALIVGQQPNGVVVAPNEDIFVVVAAAGGPGVVKVSGGVATKVSSSGGVVYMNPQGIARANNGDLFVANRGGHNILRVPGGAGPPEDYITAADPIVDQPIGMTFDVSGNLLVTDVAIRELAGNAGVAQISAAKQVSVVTEGDKLQDARGIAVDTTAPSISPPPPGAGAPDTSIEVSFSAKKRQKLRKRSIAVFARCAGEPCSAAGSGTVRVPRASRTYRFKKVTKSLGASVKTKLKMRLSRKATRAARRALKRRKKVTAKVTVRVTDAAGNSASKKLRIRLKR